MFYYHYYYYLQYSSILWLRSIPFLLFHVGCRSWFLLFAVQHNAGVPAICRLTGFLNPALHLIMVSDLSICLSACLSQESWRVLFFLYHKKTYFYSFIVAVNVVEHKWRKTLQLVVMLRKCKILHPEDFPRLPSDYYKALILETSITLKRIHIDYINYMHFSKICLHTLSSRQPDKILWISQLEARRC